MEGPKGLGRRAAPERIGEPGDRARVGTRQIGDGRIDQRADPLRFRGEARERLADRTARPAGGFGDRRRIGFAPGRAERRDDVGDLRRAKADRAGAAGSASGSSAAAAPAGAKR